MQKAARKYIKLIALYFSTSTLIIFVSLTCAANTASANPFSSFAEVQKALSAIGFDKGSNSIKVTVTADGTSESTRYHQPSGITYRSYGLLGYLYAEDVIKIVPTGLLSMPLVKLQVDLSALTRLNEERSKLGFDFIDVDEDSGGYTFSVPLIGRQPVAAPKGIIRTDEWTEGNVQYALVSGRMRAFSNLPEISNKGSGSFSEEITYTIIVDRDPASSSWTFSSYRGKKSAVDKISDESVGRAAAQLDDYGRLLETAFNRAQSKIADEQSRKAFQRYRRQSDILGLSLSENIQEPSILVHLIPFNPPRLNVSRDEPFSLAAESYCDALTVGRYADWRLPTQSEVRDLFAGEITTWDAPLAFRDAPDFRFWGSFFAELMQMKSGPYRLSYPLFISSDTRTFMADNIYGQTQQFRSVYFVSVSVPRIREFQSPIGAVVKPGEARDPEYSGADLYGFCVSSSPADLSLFLGRKVSASDEPRLDEGDKSAQEQTQSLTDGSVGDAEGEITQPGVSRYSVVVMDQPISWHQARELAKEMGGSLATIRTQQDQDDVWKAVLKTPDSWVQNSVGFVIGPWLGGFQREGAVEPAEGWQWVDGNPITFANWNTEVREVGRQPNNTEGIEDALVFMGFGELSPWWNDYPSEPTGQGWQEQISSFVFERGASDALVTTSVEAPVTPSVKTPGQPLVEPPTKSPEIVIANLPAAVKACFSNGFETPVELRLQISVNVEGEIVGVPQLLNEDQTVAGLREAYLTALLALDGCSPLQVQGGGGTGVVNVIISPSGSVVSDLHVPQDTTVPPVEQTEGPRVEQTDPPPGEVATTTHSEGTLEPTSADTEAQLRLARAEVRQIQARLQVMGFDPNGIDGVLGMGARKAIRAWQAQQQLPETGYLGKAQLDLLRIQSEPSYVEWLEVAANRDLIESKGNSAVRTGRYVDARGCLREANGRAVPNFKAGC